MRPRLLTIVLLSVVTSAASLTALGRILSITTAQRIERARDAITGELTWLSSQPDPAKAFSSSHEMFVVGLRAGVVVNSELPARLPPAWGPALTRAVANATTIEQELNEGVLVISASPLGDGRSVWAGTLIHPSVFLFFWQSLIVVLALATALLVSVALSAVVSFKRSTAALLSCLDALGRDLSSPIPRSSIRELAEISDGIELLARELARSREAQEQLGQELAQKERLAALGRVVAGVAHEVRNPLASIKLHLDLAAATANLPSDVKGAVTHASEEITRLDRLVADLLVVSGRRTGPLMTVPVDELVQRRVSALAPWVATHHVSVQTEGRGTAQIDPDSLGRALDNLLRNAVEAAPEGSVVSVRVVDENERLRVRVEDHGVGISPEHSAELFEPFFTTKPDGTGLGLAISRAIARAHGGELSYRRRDGTTTFELSLARSQGRAA